MDLLNSFLTTLALRAGNAAIIGDNGSFDFAQSTQQELQRRAQEFGFEINMTTRDKISDAIAEAIENEQGIPGIMQAIEGVYSGFDDGRLSLIARTEAGAAVNLATLDSYRQSNVVVGKEWIATNDGRTRTEHRELDGEIVSLDKNFSNGLRYPNEPNCRCTIGPVTDQ